MDNLSLNLSMNLETLRKKRNLTQSQMAKLANIPRSTMTHLESGGGNPTLQNLVKISQVLQVPIEELLKKPRSEGTHILKKDIPVKIKALGNAKIYKILMDTIPGMEIDKLELQVGASFSGIAHLRGTKEYFYCEKGSFKIAISGEQYYLLEGDLLVFSGDQSHSYCNFGKKVAIGFSVIAF